MKSWYGSLSKRIGQSFTRYYVLLQLRSTPSAKTLWILAFLHSFQLLTLLLPVQPNEGDPWAHSVFWPCWYALNSIGRQDRILQQLLSSIEVTWMYVGLVGSRLVTLALCAGRYGWQSKAEYWRLVSGGKEDSLGRWLGRGDRGTRWLLSVLLYVPAANYLMQAVMCGFVCGSVFLVAAFALPAAVLCTLADHCFTVNIACTANNPGPIAPQYTLKCTASDLAIALLVPLCSSQHALS